MSDRTRAIAAVLGLAWVATWAVYALGDHSTQGAVLGFALILCGCAWSYAMWPWRPGPHPQQPAREPYERPDRGPLLQRIRRTVLVALVAALAGVAMVGASILLERADWQVEDVYEQAR